MDIAILDNHIDLNDTPWFSPNNIPIKFDEPLIIGAGKFYPEAHVTYDDIKFYEGLIPDNIRTENEIKGWFKKQEALSVTKRNQQGKMVTKYRKKRYAKDSRMYIRKNK